MGGEDERGGRSVDKKERKKKKGIGHLHMCSRSQHSLRGRRSERPPEEKEVGPYKHHKEDKKSFFMSFYTHTHTHMMYTGVCVCAAQER